MNRPLSRAKMLENAAFLRALARTGNARAAAEETGVSHSVFYRRRLAHPQFRQRWDVAAVMAQVRLRTARIQGRPGAATGREMRTEGGEAVTAGIAGGRLQIRRAHPNKLTRACEQAFLAALSATANIALSAAAAGASANAFRMRRATNPAFAREMKLALQTGYQRVEMALLESWNPASREDEGSRDNEPPPVLGMTPAQALQLLYLHQKEARLSDGHAAMRRRRGETGDMMSARLGRAYVAKLAQEAEDGRLATVLRNDATADVRRPGGMDDVGPLPALDQVTGWSRADPVKAPTDPGRALFGGWRIGDMTEEQREKGRARRRKRGG